MAKVSIIVLQYNHSDCTLACLESLRPLNADVIVVDNASDVQHLKNVEYWITSGKLSNYELLMSNKNLGYSGGNNIGIRYALEHGAEYVLILNNDTVVEPDFLDQLLKVDADIIGVEEGTGIIGHRYLVGYALLIKRAVFERVGILDERYFLYYDEVEYCARAQKAGFTLGIANKHIHHATSATTKSLGPATFLYYHRRNALLFYTTHGPWWVKIALPFWKLWTKLKQHIKIALGRDVEISKAILQGVQDYDNHRFGMRVS